MSKLNCFFAALVITINSMTLLAMNHEYCIVDPKEKNCINYTDNRNIEHTDYDRLYFSAKNMNAEKLYNYKENNRDIIADLVFNKINIINSVDDSDIYSDLSYCQLRNLGHKSELENTIKHIKKILLNDNSIKNENDWYNFTNNARLYLIKNKVSVKNINSVLNITY